MPKPETAQLSRRERQVMDILYRRGRATAAEVRGAMPDAPSYSSVRTILRILEEKGHIAHQEDAARYIYRPRVKREQATRSALKHLLDTFFGGSAEKAVVTLLDSSSTSLSAEELDRIERMIEKVRKTGNL
jgi:BlaI family transcriptional regulator, penicillinase repressor